MCASILLFFFVASCSNDMESIDRFSKKNQPDQQLTEAYIRRSEYGKLQLELKSPMILQYHKPETKTVYPKGAKLCFFDDDGKVRTSIEARYAISFDDRNIMKACDSVVVIDYVHGDTIYLKDITWKSDEDLIFSNHPVRSVNGQRITYGDGFVSDQRLENLHITRQRGTIEFQE